LVLIHRPPRRSFCISVSYLRDSPGRSTASLDTNDVLVEWPLRVARHLFSQGAWPLLAIDVLLALVTWWHGGALLAFVVVRFLAPFVGPTVIEILAVVQTVAGLLAALLALVLVAVAGVRAGREHPYTAPQSTDHGGVDN